jgi:hypothetical protein
MCLEDADGNDPQLTTVMVVNSKNGSKLYAVHPKLFA